MRGGERKDRRVGWGISQNINYLQTSCSRGGGGGENQGETNKTKPIGGGRGGRLRKFQKKVLDRSVLKKTRSFWFPVMRGGEGGANCYPLDKKRAKSPAKVPDREVGKGKFEAKPFSGQSVSLQCFRKKEGGKEVFSIKAHGG